TFNPMSGNSYSVTRIADIQLYTDGEGDPTPDTLVDPNAPATPPTDDPTDTDPSTNTGAADPADTTTPDSDPTDTDAPKKGCGSALSSASVMAAAMCAAAAVCVGKKKED
ncbi:MAG: hypothetical protein IJ363_11000, partial [Clostridia bacterium]|nr:hypothetical protein [Clostridia bacterium]